MKLNDLLTEYSDKIEAWRADKNLRTTKETLEAGGTVDIVNAGGARGRVSWGTLLQLGWAKKDRTRYEERWVYMGPPGSSIRVFTGGAPQPQILKPGEGTEWIEVDYS